MTKKEKIVSFLWQHVLLLVSLWIMTLGVALCVRSQLGCSVISILPYVFETAGEEGLAPALTIGQFTYIMNAILVVGQIALLRRKFEPVQLFQLVIGFLFGSLIDLNMLLTQPLAPTLLPSKALCQFLGCTIVGLGIALEIRCGSVTMPGEGITVAVSQVSGIPFPKAKIMVDSLLVVLGVVACYAFFGRWMWNIIGPGTLFAMAYVGYVVRLANPHLGWFNRLLAYQPGFRRYIYGLARLLYKDR